MCGSHWEQSGQSKELPVPQATQLAGRGGLGGPRGGAGTHHVLHADGDLPVAVEGSVKPHDVGGIALVQHLQLPDDLVADGWLDLQVD